MISSDFIIRKSFFEQTPEKIQEIHELNAKK